MTGKDRDYENSVRANLDIDFTKPFKIVLNLCRKILFFLKNS